MAESWMSVVAHELRSRSQSESVNAWNYDMLGRSFWAIIGLIGSVAGQMKGEWSHKHFQASLRSRPSAFGHKQ